MSEDYCGSPSCEHCNARMGTHRPAPPADVRPECNDFCPPTWEGPWRNWHRGHGCDRDDGRPREETDERGWPVRRAAPPADAYTNPCVKCAHPNYYHFADRNGCIQCGCGLNFWPSRYEQDAPPADGDGYRRGLEEAARIADLRVDDLRSQIGAASFGSFPDADDFCARAEIRKQELERIAAAIRARAAESGKEGK